MTDTKPGRIDPSTVEGYEPPVDGESQQDKRNRKARNRRRVDKARAAAKSEASPAGVSSAKGPGRPSKRVKRSEDVAGLVGLIGLAVMPFERFDGETIIEGSSALGDAVAKIAEDNPRIAKVIDGATNTAGWLDLFLAIGGIGGPILAHHADKRRERLGEHKADDAVPTEPKPKPAPPFTVDLSQLPDDGAPAPGVSGDAPVFEARHVDNGDDEPAVPTFHARH